MTPEQKEEFLSLLNKCEVAYYWTQEGWSQNDEPAYQKIRQKLIDFVNSITKP